MKYDPTAIIEFLILEDEETERIFGHAMPLEPLQLPAYYVAAMHGYADGLIGGIGEDPSGHNMVGEARPGCVLAAALACRRGLRNARMYENQEPYVVPVHRRLRGNEGLLNNGLTASRAISYFDHLFEIAALGLIVNRNVVWRWSE